MYINIETHIFDVYRSHIIFITHIYLAYNCNIVIYKDKNVMYKTEEVGSPGKGESE